MKFDARTAKALQPGKHIIFSDYPGLRFVATVQRRTWLYRYKSPIDGRMRQVSIGHWPAMSFPAAIVAWEELRCKRDHGSDPALESRQTKKAKADNKKDKDVEQAYTVQVLCDEYLEGYIDRNRGEKSRRNTRSTSRVNCPYARFIGHATCCF